MGLPEREDALELGGGAKMELVRRGAKARDPTEFRGAGLYKGVRVARGHAENR